MTRRVIIIGIIAIIVIATLIVSILQLYSDEPCVYLEGIAFGMSSVAVEKRLGAAEEISASKVSDERWYTYHSTYDEIPIKVTLTFLQTSDSDKLIGISVQNEKQMSKEEVARVTECMTRQIREAYLDRDGYYERTENSTIKLGVEEGATGVFFMIEQQTTAFSAQGRRLD